MKKNIRESESKTSINKRIKIYSKDTLSGIVKSYLNGSLKISPYEAKMCFHWSQSLVETMRFQRKTFSCYTNC